MPILIWDNGLDYSDHGVYFVEIGDVAPEHAEVLLKMHHGCGYVDGIADRIEWREGGAADLFDLVSPRFQPEDATGLPADLVVAVMTHELNRLQELVKQTPEGSGWRNNVERSIAEVTAFLDSRPRAGRDAG